MDGDRELDGDELMCWLALYVMDWETYPVQLETGAIRRAWRNANHEHTARHSWDPLESLDDARQLEDRLRELGMAEDYAYELSRATRQQNDGIKSVLAIRFLSAREICEAVRRTWLNRKDATSGTESVSGV